MKKRTLGLIIAGVAAASMIGTGFAAWVITGNATADKQGNFYVDTVTDKSITMTAEWAQNEDGNINFLGPDASAQTATNQWLAYDALTVESKTLNEDLSETLELSFELGTNVNASEFTVSYELVVDAGFNTAKAANYVTGPSINGTALTQDATTATKYTGSTTLDAILVSDKADVVIAFGWGTAFDSKNPYTFYNGLTYNTKYTKNAETGKPEAAENGTPIQTIAKNDLTALNQALENATFTLTVTVAKTAA